MNELRGERGGWTECFQEMDSQSEITEPLPFADSSPLAPPSPRGGKTFVSVALGNVCNAAASSQQPAGEDFRAF